MFNSDSSSNGQNCTEVEALAEQTRMDLQACQSSLAEKRVNAANEKLLFESEVESLRQEKTDLDTTIYQLRQTVANLRSQNEKLVKDNIGLKLISENASYDKLLLENNVKSLQQKSNVLKMKADKLSQTVTNLTSQNQKLVEENIELKSMSENTNSSSEVLFLENTLNELNSSCQFVENDRSKLEIVVVDLQKSLSTSRGELTKCRDTLKHWKRKYRQSKNRKLARTEGDEQMSDHEQQISELKTVNVFLTELRKGYIIKLLNSEFCG